MPRIDPLSLLKCLSVLLGPTGGIKSKEEVHRLANLMTKFSKKLVSKCIYIQILKTTNTDLLSQFMSAGGWNLIHTWLTDGILAKNWALIQELLELLLLCPVDIERLKSNNCPKLIKGLSKEGSHQGVRTLATRLVEQWLKIVKGEAAPNSVPAQIMTVPVQSNTTAGQIAVIPSSQQHYLLNSQQTLDIAETVHVQDFKLVQSSTTSTTVNQIQQDQEKQQQERLQSQTIQVGKGQQATQQQTKKQSFVVVTTSSQSVPVYKITIRDGNQVLAKVETDVTNINSVLSKSGTNAEVVINTVDAALPASQEARQETEEVEETGQSGSVTSGQDETVDIGLSDNSGHVSSDVKQTIVSSKDIQDIEGAKSKDNKDSKDIIIINSDSGKSSDKENRDSHKKDDKKSSSDKKSSTHHHSSSSSSKSSSKHSTSSSTHRSSSTSHKSSSHRSSSSSKSSNSSKDKSSKEKDKHHSSSSSKHSSSKNKSERDKERDKEKQKKDQAEKDKATLEKVQGQALSSKLGKIPKKRTEDDTNGRKSSTESRDGTKENKEKVDSSKKDTVTKLTTEKKNISISIENRKNSQDSTTRPKTVKTYNSKFRSTGLEEEVKPPPPRSKKPNPAVDKKVLPPKFPLKRPSPIRETIPIVEKRVKLSLDSPTTPPSDEKKGGIKLIPPKPKPMMLQESDMFMDALTASTKSKEPRKRKRRTSITKDGSSEAKKQEIANTDNRESTPPPSPTNVEEKSSVALKPNFKFYQDTLEIEEDKDQREKENSEEDLKKDKDDLKMFDDEKDNRDDDDSRSNTPTPEEDVEEKRKGPKKVLRWKTDLESIRYFELDETERVNVTKTFTDMKQMEKQNEREAFQMARKLNNEDLMEERTRWKPLIPIDQPPPLVEPGKDSKEKDIQYAREKGILQALYFNRSMIPDSAAEPDEERHHVMTDPKIIPLDDLTGNKESEKDFTSVPWPEPKPQLTPQPPTVTTFHYPTTFSHNQQTMMTPMGPQTTMGPMPQMPQQMMPPSHIAPMTQEMPAPTMPGSGGGGWRTGDGKVLVPDVGMNPMANMPGNFNQGMEGAPMVPPGMMGPPPMYNQQQEGYGMMCPEDMGFNNMNPNFQGPPGPMYGPGPNFPGPRGAPMHTRGRGGPGWGYRGAGPPRGGWRGGGGGWRGNGKQPPVCRQFSKNGFCRVGDKCQYLHPGVNCPPF
ncbi:serine/threonine-protein phosphatase 1 regulatory subunit 10 isoform X2 [Nylanderia fulva]|uniref:serine/threonine-protein phosphatase 1 regulatory subunit 10 isoform X2 n=1 Tax=Nylanderia fulva TaxID=613905 RepID=UPI0010FB6BF0|nr:serine/threonine-protein phosphatase 1 regulatory subunit 10 isoform X2 [Nylanderia fulva]